MLRGRLLALLLAVALTATALPAYAWYADFFYDEASGNGTYEAGFINPEAVYDKDVGKTYVVFQGPKLDPYIAAVDAAGKWEGPYKIGDSALDTKRPLDTHGGPSVVIKDGYLHVFYGGHNSDYLKHAKSREPHRIDRGWVDGKIRLGVETDDLKGTYPQPWVTDDGRIGLVYRRGAGTGDDAKMSWQLSFRAPESQGATWTPAETVADDDEGSQYYVSTAGQGDGSLHVGFVRRDRTESVDDPFARRDVFYLKRDASGAWANARGDDISTRTIEYLETKEENGGALVRDSEPDEYVNQIVTRVDHDGNPALLFLKGRETPTREYQWTFQRWNEAHNRWDEVSTGLPTTDHTFDAGDFWFDDADNAHAYLTAGGTPDDQTTIDDKYAARGGDIVEYTLARGSEAWSGGRTIKDSPDATNRYNNPQIYGADEAGTKPGVLFSEWNNDVTSFIHKMFLYRDGQLVGREFTPEVLRLAGENRVETSVKISREAFPVSANAIVLASSADYADALAGVPLAQSYNAPVLLCSPEKMPAVLEGEFKRLKLNSAEQPFQRVILLGGEKALSSAVMSRVKQLVGSKTVVERIGGANRYETAYKIALRLRSRKGTPDHVVIASGANFADALAVSPYAARQGIPVLLTSPTVLPTATRQALATLAPEYALITGGPVAVSDDVEGAVRAYTDTDRVWGDNRYETARDIAEMSIESAKHTLERPVIASGANFADAVPGGLLAARYNTVVVLTTPGGLAPAARETLAGATQVLEAYVLGGPVALNPNIDQQLTSIFFGK